MPKQAANANASKRSAVTGRQLGKRAAKAEEKNADGVKDFETRVTAVANSWKGFTLTDSAAIPAESEGFMLGRVIRGHGAGRVEVQLFSGGILSARVAGRIAFRGTAATKTDREACLCAGDYIVVEGPMAAAKMQPRVAKNIVALYLTGNPRLVAPKNFFDETEEEEQGFVWDRSEEGAEDGQEVDVDVL